MTLRPSPPRVVNPEPEPPPLDVSLDEQGKPVVKVGAEAIWGLLAPFDGRPRTVLVMLLRGVSRKMAATAAGIASTTLEGWIRDSLEYRRAVETAQQWGFSAVYESELYDRALDRSDRSSGRLLEVVLKSRDAAYRDKSTLQLEVVTKAQEAVRDIGAGWRALEAGDGDEGNPS